MTDVALNGHLPLQLISADDGFDSELNKLCLEMQGVPNKLLCDSSSQTVDEEISKIPSSQVVVEEDNSPLGLMKCELAKLTGSVQKDLRENLQEFLSGWAQADVTAQVQKAKSKSKVMENRRPSDQSAGAHTIHSVSDAYTVRDSALLAEDPEDEHEWLMRPMKSHLASEYMRPSDSIFGSVNSTAKDDGTGSRPSAFSMHALFRQSKTKTSLVAPVETAQEDTRKIRFSPSVGSDCDIPRKERSCSIDSDAESIGWINMRTSVQSDAKPMFTAMGVHTKSSNTVDLKERHFDSCTDCIAKVILNEYFNYSIGLLIALNAVWIGVQTEWAVRAATAGSSSTPDFLRTVSSCFCFVFTVEVILRIMVHRMQFFLADDWRWNMFDLTIVALQFVEEVLEYSLDGNVTSTGSSWMRVLRALRLARIARLVRVLRILTELRTMLGSIMCTMGSLCWTLVLLLLITYAASICIAQTVADHGLIKPEDVAVGSPLQIYYGSLGSSMIALYQAISGGVDWRQMSDPLDEQIGTHMSLFLVMFIAFTTLSLLNIVTGIFVEAALQNSKMEGDLNMVNRLREVIDLANVSEDGQISWTDFNGHLDTPQMRAYFKSVDLDVSEAKALFKLLDTGDTGAINVEEFINGCLRLRGTARAIDLATLMSQTTRMHRQWRVQMSHLQTIVSGLPPDQSCNTTNFSTAGSSRKLSTKTIGLAWQHTATGLSETPP